MKIFPIDSSMKKTVRPYEVEIPNNGTDELPFTGKHENANSCQHITQTQQFIGKKKSDLKKAKKTGKGVAFNDKELPAGSGVQLDEENVLKVDSSGSGIAFNDEGSGASKNDNPKLTKNYHYSIEDLEKDLQTFEETRTGGAIPAIVGELALNLVAQAPAIISAIKARQKGKAEGSGVRNSEVARLLTANGALDWDSLDEEDYENLISGFKKIHSQGKRYIQKSGSGITAKSNKVGKFFNKAWSWLKGVYNNNRDIIDPLKDALINSAKNAVTSTINDTINKGTAAINSKIKNDTVKELINKTGETVKQLGDRTVENVAQTVQQKTGGRIPSLMNNEVAINKAGNYKISGSIF